MNINDTTPPDSKIYVQKLLQLSRELLSTGQKEVAFEALCRADRVFKKLSLDGQLSIVEEMTDALISVGPPDTSQKQFDVVSETLHVISTLKSPVTLSTGAKLTRLRDIYVPALAKTGPPGFPSGPEISQAELISRTACQVYDHFAPNSLQGVREHYQLGLICQRLGNYPLALLNFNQAKAANNFSALSRTERQSIVASALDAGVLARGKIIPSRITEKPTAEMMRNLDTQTRLKVLQSINAMPYKTYKQTCMETVNTLLWEEDPTTRQKTAILVNELANKIRSNYSADQLANFYNATLQVGREHHAEHSISYIEICASAASNFNAQTQKAQVKHFTTLALAAIGADYSNYRLIPFLNNCISGLASTVKSTGDTRYIDEFYLQLPPLKVAPEESSKQAQALLVPFILNHGNDTKNQYEQNRRFLFDNLKNPLLQQHLPDHFPADFESFQKAKNNYLMENLLQKMANNRVGDDDGYIDTPANSETDESSLAWQKALDFCNARWAIEQQKKSVNETRLLEIARKTMELQEKLKSPVAEINASHIRLKRLEIMCSSNQLEPETKTVAVCDPARVINLELCRFSIGHPRLLHRILFLSALESFPGINNSLFVSQLSILAIGLEAEKDHRNARIAAALVNNIYASLSTKDQLESAYDVCDIASYMPIYRVSHGCIGGNDGPEALPVIDNILPVIITFECKNSEKIAMPLGELRDKYIKAGLGYRAIEIAKTVVILTNKYSPDTIENFKAYVALEQCYSGSLSDRGSQKKAIDQAMRICAKLTISPGEKREILVDLMTYLTKLNEGTQVKSLFEQNRKLLLDDKISRRICIESLVATHNLDKVKELMASSQLYRCWAETISDEVMDNWGSHPYESDPVERITSSLIRQNEIALAERIIEDTLTQAVRAGKTGSKPFQKLCLYGVNTALTNENKSLAKKLAEMLQFENNKRSDNLQVEEIANLFRRHDECNFADKWSKQHNKSI